MGKASWRGRLGTARATRPLIGAVLGLCGLVWLAGTRHAVAEADRGAARTEVVADEPIVDDDEVGAGAAADPGQATQPDDSGSVAPSESILSWAFRSLGWTYSIVFLSLSFTMVALFVMNVIMARRENVIPTELVRGFEQRLIDKQYQEAYDLARTDESFLGQVLAAGLGKLSTAGYQQAIEAMQEVGEDENMKLDHRLSYIALIGTISPMIGLFGTVHGMVMAFQVIATSTTAPRPAELANGIATALWTTLVGLFIAIPALSAYHILRNRFARLVLEVGIESERLMSRFQNVGVRKPAAATPSAASSSSPPPPPTS
ncbi:MAG: hypothetical protein A2W31_06390 [Planctomycetes bacterium RBG_16_64_10]|nr:MAG: hypothetical protein A2W31_06390 [Planctomycetes bacterium RBG_16_64_10]